MSGTEQPRLLLLVESDPAAVRCVHWAVRLAALRKARVQALFIERGELLLTAGLPFTREISRYSARSRDFSPASVAEQFDRLFGRLQQQLAREAALHQVLWHCERRRLERGAAPAEDVGLVDMLMAAPQHWRSSPPAVLYVVFNGTAAAERALASGLELAALGGQRLVLLLPDTADVDALQARSRAVQQAAGPQAQALRPQHITIHNAESMAALKVTAARLQGELLLLPGELIGLDPAHLDELLEVLPLPVVVVR